MVASQTTISEQQHSNGISRVWDGRFSTSASGCAPRWRALVDSNNTTGEPSKQTSPHALHAHASMPLMHAFPKVSCGDAALWSLLRSRLHNLMDRWSERRRDDAADGYKIADYTHPKK